MNPLNDENCLPEHLELLNGEKLIALPPLYLLNHIQHSHLVFQLRSSGLDLFTDVYDISASVHSFIKQAYELSKNSSIDSADVRQKSDTTTQFPAVVSMLGRPVYQKKLTKAQPVVTDTEREVCRLMAVHRACAKDGIVIELGDTLPEMFVLLEQLEDHCKSRKIGNKYVWSTLRKIGKLFTEHMGIEKGARMINASHITAFTDFPIGLAILPSGSSPICCYKSISYRPVTPMTRAFQLEIQKVPQYYIGKQCKIVIAECLGKDDYIRNLSEGAWKVFINGSKKQKGLDAVFEEVPSVKALKQLLSKHGDADILVISAHGAYEKAANVAGLCIGNDVWLGNDDDIRMPPLVMLSACHISPRGSGSVNVADLLIRAGARAVLGTFIPVDVRRNSLLYIRLFAYIQAAMEGNTSYRTILDAWSGVVATNAVNEIISESPKLMNWFMSTGLDGKPRMVDFMMNRSKGQLHGRTIYDDTLKIMREMACEDGVEQLFDSVINSQGFFPESLFYQMMGFPENIFLYHPAFEVIHNK